jgi:hypothetical protein
MVRRLPIILLVAAAVAAPSATAFSAGAPAFRGTISVIREPLRQKLISWHPGCPVGLDDLRLLTVSHWGFDRKAHTGKLVVHEDVAEEVVSAMRALYDERFPIRRMRLVDAYGASDFASIEADNTSAFNCRYVDGTNRWSEHAYGRAIDVNPIENPYVTSGGQVSHDASRTYVDRSRYRRGMAVPGGVLVGAFQSIGWGWGGSWSGAKDYQHFSASGR